MPSSSQYTHEMAFTFASADDGQMNSSTASRGERDVEKEAPALSSGSNNVWGPDSYDSEKPTNIRGDGVSRDSLHSVTPVKRPTSAYKLFRHGPRYTVFPKARGGVSLPYTEERPSASMSSSIHRFSGANSPAPTDGSRRMKSDSEPRPPAAPRGANRRGSLLARSRSLDRGSMGHSMQSDSSLRPQYDSVNDLEELERHLRQSAECVCRSVRRMIDLKERYPNDRESRSSCGGKRPPHDLEDDFRAASADLESKQSSLALRVAAFVHAANVVALRLLNERKFSQALQTLIKAFDLIQQDATLHFTYLEEEGEGGHVVGVVETTVAAGITHWRTRPSTVDLCIPYFAPHCQEKRLETAAVVYNNMGLYHFKLGEYGLAAQCISEALVLEKQLNTDTICITYFNLAQSQWELRKRQQALVSVTLAGETSERQVHQNMDEFTVMRRRHYQSGASAELEKEGALVPSFSVLLGKRVTSCSSPPLHDSQLHSEGRGSHAASEASGDHALVSLWLKWRDSVCFISRIKAQHGEWLHAETRYREAIQCYERSIHWLASIPRLSEEEKRRLGHVRGQMLESKKALRRLQHEEAVCHRTMKHRRILHNGQSMSTRIVTTALPAHVEVRDDVLSGDAHINMVASTRSVDRCATPASTAVSVIGGTKSHIHRRLDPYRATVIPTIRHGTRGASVMPQRMRRNRAHRDVEARKYPCYSASPRTLPRPDGQCSSVYSVATNADEEGLTMGKDAHRNIASSMIGGYRRAPSIRPLHEDNHDPIGPYHDGAGRDYDAVVDVAGGITANRHSRRTPDIELSILVQWVTVVQSFARARISNLEVQRRFDTLPSMEHLDRCTNTGSDAVNQSASQYSVFEDSAGRSASTDMISPHTSAEATVMGREPKMERPTVETTIWSGQSGDVRCKDAPVSTSQAKDDASPSGGAQPPAGSNRNEPVVETRATSTPDHKIPTPSGQGSTMIKRVPSFQIHALEHNVTPSISGAADTSVTLSPSAHSCSSHRTGSSTKYGSSMFRSLLTMDQQLPSCLQQLLHDESDMLLAQLHARRKAMARRRHTQECPQNADGFREALATGESDVGPVCIPPLFQQPCSTGPSQDYSHPVKRTPAHGEVGTSNLERQRVERDEHSLPVATTAVQRHEQAPSSFVTALRNRLGVSHDTSCANSTIAYEEIGDANGAAEVDIHLGYRSVSHSEASTHTGRTQEIQPSYRSSGILNLSETAEAPAKKPAAPCPSEAGVAPKRLARFIGLSRGQGSASLSAVEGSMSSSVEMCSRTRSAHGPSVYVGEKAGLAHSNSSFLLKSHSRDANTMPQMGSANEGSDSIRASDVPNTFSQYHAPSTITRLHKATSLKDGAQDVGNEWLWQSHDNPLSDTSPPHQNGLTRADRNEEARLGAMREMLRESTMRNEAAQLVQTAWRQFHKSRMRS